MTEKKTSMTKACSDCLEKKETFSDITAMKPQMLTVFLLRDPGLSCAAGSHELVCNSLVDPGEHEASR